MNISKETGHNYPETISGMKAIGSVEVPQEAFLSVLSMDEEDK